MRICIYARAYASLIVYTRTQFAQTNALTTRTRVYIINASIAVPRPYLHTYVHAVDREQYSQTNANARTRTQINARSSLRSTRGRFLHANAIAICALDLKLSGCTIIQNLDRVCNIKFNFSQVTIYVLQQSIEDPPAYPSNIRYAPDPPAYSSNIRTQHCIYMYVGAWLSFVL